MFGGQMGCEALNFMLKRAIKEERPKREFYSIYMQRRERVLSASLHGREGDMMLTSGAEFYLNMQR